MLGNRYRSRAKKFFGDQTQVKIAELLAPFSPPETVFVERMMYWTLAQPEDIAFRYLRDSGEVVAYTYSQLDERARAIAAYLVGEGMRGQRALLMYPPGLEFVEALFGCLYAGVVAIPAYPPRRNRNMGRINAISEDADASIALTVFDVKDRREGMLDDAPKLRQIPWVATERIPTELCSDWVKPKVMPRETAIIQYTSGSTGSPKGVMLSHANLIANCKMITEAFELRHADIGCSWLPAYHDMGLIGGILNPVFAGIEQNLMSPISLLTRPLRWLQAISRYSVTCSGGPNFAYAMCADKILDEQCEGLDLSTWSIAFNGAEPVRANVLRAFSRRFEKYGFRHEAHYPCYGMAESSLIITGGKQAEAPIIRAFDRVALVEHRVVSLTEGDSKASDLVGCGQVLPGEEMLIVHPESRKLMPENEIGEVWVTSSSVGQGYWNKPEETARTFHATLNPDNGKRYLRTGDLGFMDRGELFITGRLKDMIIIRGVNRYPQDIEATVEACDQRLRNSGAAAFAVQRWDREHLVVVAEVERSPNSGLDGIIEKIRKSVIAEHDVPPDAIVLVRANSVPKTSSGKVQRHACRINYLENKLLVLDRWSVLDETEAVEAAGEVAAELSESDSLDSTVLAMVIKAVKQVGAERARNVNADSNIVVDLGLDSLERLEIARILETTFGGRIPDEVLQEIETVREVASAVQEHLGTKVVKEKAIPQGQPKIVAAGRPIPETYYVLEKTPEFVRLQRNKEQIFKTGLRNPFFTVHDGVIADTTHIDGRELISFSSYNYLGLSGHPEVSASAKKAIDTFGTSVSASRLVSGEKTIHRELEKGLSEFLGVEDVITFPGGHATNESVIGHLVGAGDLILHDALAHNSIIQGAELSGARRRPFDHNDWQHLDDILTENRSEYRRVLIAIEGLYSMDGDFPDIPEFVRIKKKHFCWLFIDEAHSIGTLGTTGRGVAELFDIPRNDVECWMGTLSKSFGSCGGFVGGTRNLIEYLRYTTPGYVFAAGIPPANVGAALGSLKMIQKEPERVAKLRENSALFLKLAKAAKLNTGVSHDSPIIPAITGSSVNALRLSQGLFDRGINAQPILYPAVAEDQTRVRFFISAAHREDQIRKTLEVAGQIWKEISG
ncbi:MAG: aminotransferase class I/II-fold pyridoxal phosphate-dependent enzyme [Pirellulaceae bacterium]